VVNPFGALLGERGTMRAFAARSGACATQVRRLERGLERYANVVRASSGEDVTRLRGAGAGGGLGAGLAIFLGAKLTPRLAFLRHGLGVDRSLEIADLAIAVADGEDAVYEVPGWVVWRARTLGLPVVTLDRPAESDGPSRDRPSDEAGLDAHRREEAWPRTRDWLRRAGSGAIRSALHKMVTARCMPGPTNPTAI
jgi:hypothetical protein